MENTGHDEHIIEAIGKCRIVIRDGKVISVGGPRISRCPLARRFAEPVHEIEPGSVRKNIENRIRTFGMCTPERQVSDDHEFVGFGASELISAGISGSLLDAAVIVCDGAGTVVVRSPALVQGIGGRMSGIMKTSPIPEVMDAIERAGGSVLDRTSAAIDQVAGTGLAYRLGHGHVAVTITAARDAVAIRALYPDVLIIGVHMTGTTPEDAAILSSTADLLTACASQAIRVVSGRAALLQAGTAVPVFAMTGKGKELILEKIRSTGTPFLVQSSNLPFPGPQQPEPLV